MLICSFLYILVMMLFLCMMIKVWVLFVFKSVLGGIKFFVFILLIVSFNKGLESVLNKMCFFLVLLVVMFLFFLIVFMFLKVCMLFIML